MHGLRAEYQDQVNFVILDYDGDEDRDLAKDLGIARHPAFGLVAPDSDEVVGRMFGPQTEDSLRNVLDGFVADYGSP